MENQQKMFEIVARNHRKVENEQMKETAVGGKLNQTVYKYIIYNFILLLLLNYGILNMRNLKFNSNGLNSMCDNVRLV